MKKYLLIISFVFISFISLNLTSAGIFSSDEKKIPYDNEELGLKEGVDFLKETLNNTNTGIEIEGTASEYIQGVVIYLLGFLALISVILIIYAGFNLLISVGDEEKAKKSKTIIFYSLLGLIVIFLAWPITSFVIGFLT